MSAAETAISCELLAEVARLYTDALHVCASAVKAESGEASPTSQITYENIWSHGFNPNPHTMLYVIRNLHEIGMSPEQISAWQKAHASGPYLEDVEVYAVLANMGYDLGDEVRKDYAGVAAGEDSADDAWEPQYAAGGDSTDGQA